MRANCWIGKQDVRVETVPDPLCKKETVPDPAWGC